MGKSKGQQQSKGNSGNRSPGLGLLDRQMVKRVEAHVAAGTPMDVDKIADELRKSYREYQRIKSAPFRALIAKSVQSLRGRGQERTSSGPGEEAALQVASSLLLLRTNECHCNASSQCRIETPPFPPFPLLPVPSSTGPGVPSPCQSEAEQLRDRHRAVRGRRQQRLGRQRRRRRLGPGAGR